MADWEVIDQNGTRWGFESSQKAALTTKVELSKKQKQWKFSARPIEEKK